VSTLFTGIGSLALTGKNFGEIEVIENAALAVSGGKVTYAGSAGPAPTCDEVVDLDGRSVIPGFVDSHAHLMFAGERSEEFASRITGKPYAAGGIKNTVKATRSASDDELRENAKALINEFYSSGITQFEIKSGYGLDVETEVRSLKIASELTEHTTFLGAHVVPEGIERSEYVALLKGEMLQAVKSYAKWIDVFCDQGAFTALEAKEILEAGISLGLKPRMHANQLANIGAIPVALELGCASVDHCTHLSAEDITLLSGSETVVTLLPGAEFSTKSPYPDGRRLASAGITLAIATDCNPGSSYTTSMPFCIAIAVREMGLSPEQALWAATKGGAKALKTEGGSLEVGDRADFAVLDAPSHIYLSYRPGVQLISATYIGGNKVFERN
jgi:imidazolonepropionase